MPNPRSIIVVVDDDAGMNQAIERLLKATGFQALTFSSGEALLDAGLPKNTACLIFDVHLPTMTGFELHQQITREGARLPVIFITAYDDPDSHARSASAGAVAFLTKPFSGQKLISAIFKAIGSEPPISTPKPVSPQPKE